MPFFALATWELQKCENCDKEFILKWRMRKHQKNHTNKSLRKCHYFNNNLTCPFAEMGCIFAHEPSKMCKYDAKCTNHLCSFQYQKSLDKDTLEENTKTHKCQEYDEILYYHNNLINHVENIHVQNEGKNRDHLFPQNAQIVPNGYIMICICINLLN